MPDHHHHHHQHHHFSRMDDPDFDWSATAEWLQLDGLIVMPLVDLLVDELTTNGLKPADVREVVDVGSGPGVITCELARRFPHATVFAVDSAPPLLQHVHDRAWTQDLSRRVMTVAADIEVELPIDGTADLAWVAMVIHHVAEPVTALRRIHDALKPGGQIVVTEFAGDPVAFVDTDPIVATGAWARLAQASVAERTVRLGFDFIGHDWAADLTAAGFIDVSDEVKVFNAGAPLNDAARQWLVRHLRRGLELAGSGLTTEDITAMEHRADEIERGERFDAFLTSERRVLFGRRPLEQVG